MTAGFPDFGMHDDCGFKAYDVLPKLGHGPPPGFLNVPLEFGAEWTVIPESVEATVDFGRLENKAPPFAQRNDFLHQFGGFRFCHKRASVLDANPGVNAAAGLGADVRSRKGAGLERPATDGNLIAFGLCLVAKDAIAQRTRCEATLGKPEQL